MRSALWLLALVALAAADPWEEPWVEEEDLEEPYSEEREPDPRAAVADVPRPRPARDVTADSTHHAEEESYRHDDEHVRVKRHYRDEAPDRVRRETDYNRVPRQAHQYEVHEFTEEDSAFPSVPYEEMLAASAEHYHRTYAAPGAPAAARYVHQDVSGVPLGVRPVPSVTNFNPSTSHHRPARRPLAYAEPPQRLVAAPPSNLVNHGASSARPVPNAGPHEPRGPLASPGAGTYSATGQAVPHQIPVSYAAPSYKPVSFAARSQNSGHHAASAGPAPQPQVNVATNHFEPQAFAPVKQVITPSIVTQSPVQFVASNVHRSPKGLSIPVDGPLPVSSEPIAPVTQLADGDLLGSAGGHAHQHHQHKAHGHGHSAGGGHSKHADHHAAHGGKTKKGSHTVEHSGKGAKGHKLDEHHKKEYEEAEGHKKKHHDHADHKGGHEEEAHGHRGAHFGEKKGHKKGHKTKGYHNKYHKDEFHKEHKFYDDFHKSGEHHRFGKFHAKHASNESGKKKAHHVNAGHDFVERGKKGYSNKGHLDADHKGHKAKHGHEEHHENHKKHGKKGGSEGGKEWGYAKKA